MSKKYVISDLHFGHTNILKFSGPLRGGTTSKEHDEWLITQWNSVVTKQDLVYVLGDVAFNKEALKNIKRLKGTKHLILGNHDIEHIPLYSEYFNKIYGLHRYRGVFWMSHCPIHPQELRGLFNIHGHTHQNKIVYPGEVLGLYDPRYVSACVEESYGIPQDLDKLCDIYKPLVDTIRSNKNDSNS